MSFVDLFRHFLPGGGAHRAMPSLDGPWRPNDDIETAPVLADALERPDDLAADDRGNLFVASGHAVIAIAPDGDRKVVERFDGVVASLAWSPAHGLIACVSGVGVVITGGTSGTRRILSETDGAALKYPSGVAVGENGDLFVTEGSAVYPYEDWVLDLMDKGATGRLLKFSGEARGLTLQSGLAFPTAPVIRSSHGAVFFAEAWRHRIWKFASSSEIVLDNLPGYVGRLIEAPTGGWYVSFFAQRTHLVEFVLKENAFREEMIATIDPRYWIAPQIDPKEHYLEPVQVGGLTSQNIKKAWAPPRSYGMVALLDGDFECLQTHHSRSNGRHHGTAGLAVLGDRLVVAAKGAGLLLTLPARGGEKT